MSITISDGLTLVIPSRAQSNWDTILRTAFEAISGHDHTGGGKGLALSAASFAANGVNDTLIRLRNGVANGLRIRNVGNTADVVAIALSAADKIRFDSTAVSSDTRADLGVAIGTNVQAYDADLSAIAALAPSNDSLLLRAAGAWSEGTPSAVRTALGLVIGTNVQAYDADLTTLGAGGAGARSFLGLAIGTDVQAYDAHLAEIAALSPSGVQFLRYNGSNWTAASLSAIDSLTGVDTLGGPQSLVIGSSNASQVSFRYNNTSFLKLDTGNFFGPISTGGANLGSNTLPFNGISGNVFNWADGAVTSSQAPQTDAAQGFLAVQVAGVAKRIPYYAV